MPANTAYAYWTSISPCPETLRLRSSAAWRDRETLPILIMRNLRHECRSDSVSSWKCFFTPGSLVFGRSDCRDARAHKILELFVTLYTIMYWFHVLFFRRRRLDGVSQRHSPDHENVPEVHLSRNEKQTFSDCQPYRTFAPEHHLCSAKLQLIIHNIPTHYHGPRVRSIKHSKKKKCTKT